MLTATKSRTRLTHAEAADLDRRKARIMAALRPTRLNRGLGTAEGAVIVAGRIGIHQNTLYSWETGNTVPKDDQVPAVEAWLDDGPVWKYTRIGAPAVLEQPKTVPQGVQQGHLRAV